MVLQGRNFRKTPWNLPTTKIKDYQGHEITILQINFLPIYLGQMYQVTVQNSRQPLSQSQTNLALICHLKHKDSRQAVCFHFSGKLDYITCFEGIDIYQIFLKTPHSNKTKITTNEIFKVLQGLQEILKGYDE